MEDRLYLKQLVSQPQDILLKATHSVYDHRCRGSCHRSLITAAQMSPVSSHPYLSEQQQADLHEVAQRLSRPGGGILAADETPAAMEARFASLDIANTPEVRRQYRQLLFSCARQELAPLSGAILQHENVHQTTDDGRSFVEVVTSPVRFLNCEIDTVMNTMFGEGCYKKFSLLKVSTLVSSAISEYCVSITVS